MKTQCRIKKRKKQHVNVHLNSSLACRTSIHEQVMKEEQGGLPRIIGRNSDENQPHLSCPQQAVQVLRWNNVALTSVKTTQASENGDSARAAAAQHFQGLVWPWQSSVAGVGGDALASLPETLGPSLMNRQKHHCVLLRFLTDFEMAHRRAPRIRVPVSKQISRAKRKEEEGSWRTKCLRYSFHLEPKYIWWWLFLNRP